VSVAGSLVLPPMALVTATRVIAGVTGLGVSSSCTSFPVAPVMALLLKYHW